MRSIGVFMCDNQPSHAASIAAEQDHWLLLLRNCGESQELECNDGASGGVGGSCVTSP